MALPRGMDDAALRRRLEILEARVEQLEAQLEAVDASFVRHQGQNENDLDVLTRTVDRVGQRVDLHEDAHWRSGR